MNYKEYIETNIFPVYEKNDKGHDINHINSVINRSLEFNKDYNLDEKLLYIAASYHDIAHYIDKDNHETLSAQIFIKDDYMKKNLSEEEIIIIKEAIEDHRSTLKTEPRSMYGKILSSADRSFDFNTFIKRTHGYSKKHYSYMTKEEMIKRAYDHIIEKYRENGYAKTYVDNDKELISFLNTVQSINGNYEQFKELYEKIIK